MGKTKSKHAHGDILFQNSTPEAKKLHKLFKESTRRKERDDWKRQRDAENSQFQR